MSTDPKSMLKDHSKRSSIKTDDMWSVKYRPHYLKDIVGQSEAVTQVKGWIAAQSVPPVVLLTGHSGCGKSSLAMVIANEINGVAKGENNPDYVNIESGDERGIDAMRNAVKNANFLPRKNIRVMVLEEVHSLTSQAFRVLLSPFEKVPQRTMWILTTDQMEKLPKPLLGRCNIINLNRPSEKACIKKFVEILAAEKQTKLAENTELLKSIAKATAGQVRSGIQLLQTVYYQIKGGSDEKEALENSKRIVADADDNKIAIKILFGIYAKVPSMVVKTLQETENYTQLISRLMDINQGYLEFLSGFTRYNSPVRTRFFDLIELKMPLKEGGEERRMRQAAHIHEMLSDLRTAMNNYAMSEIYLVTAKLTQMAIK